MLHSSVRRSHLARVHTHVGLREVHNDQNVAGTDVCLLQDLYTVLALLEARVDKTAILEEGDNMWR